MLDLGMSELLVIGIVALIVIGPKDLPGLFRSLGQFTGKMRGMAREFSRAMEAAADDSGVKDVARDLKSATSAKSMGLEAVKDAASKFEKWDPLKNAAKPSMVLPKRDIQPDPQAAPPAGTSTTEATAAEPPAPAMGPATQALVTAKAERQAIVKDVAEKLKKTAAPVAPKKTTAPATAEVPLAPAKKPRAPRKPKADQAPADKDPKADA